MTCGTKRPTQEFILRYVRSPNFDIMNGMINMSLSKNIAKHFDQTNVMKWPMPGKNMG